MASKKNKETGEIEELLTFKELSDKSGLNVSFVKRAIREYGFPYYKIGRSVKFRLSEAEAWIRQRRHAG